MKTTRCSVLLILCSTLLGAVPVLAASAYFEGWDSGTSAGWTRSTINNEVYGDAGGGNPGGSLRIVPMNTVLATIGANSVEPAVTGDWAAAGIRRVSFDLINQSVPVTQLWFHVRYIGATHNGWSYTLAGSVANGQWTSYVVEFDPTWSDAEAVAGGWQQEPASPSFATTMSAVQYPEVRINTSVPPAGAELRLDNFRLTSCSNDNEAPEGVASVSRSSLWPPTHKMVDITATVRAEDFCDSSPTVTLVDIDSDEADDGLGGGDRPGDIEILSDFSFRLRSERDSHGNGREYTITWSVEDGSGNATKVSAVVRVPVSLTPPVLAAARTSSGKRELNGDGTVTLQIPSRLKGLDAASIDPASILAGNHVGVVAPTDSYLKDVTGDGLTDLTVVFPAAEVDDLSRLAEAALLAELAADPMWDGSLPQDNHQPISLFFLANGVSYLADDITSSRLIRNTFRDITDDRINDDLQPAARPGALNFALPQAGRINVSVFDVQGRQIRTLFDGESNAGLLSLEWDRRDAAGRPAPSGMYFARITGALSEVRKIAISR